MKLLIDGTEEFLSHFDAIEISLIEAAENPASRAFRRLKEFYPDPLILESALPNYGSELAIFEPSQDGASGTLGHLGRRVGHLVFDDGKEGTMNVVQTWVQDLSMMQQTVLLTAVRGPDGLRKECAAKPLLRAYRRTILLSAMDGRVLADVFEPGGGSFTGPCRHPEGLPGVMRDYIRGVDEYPHHFHMHVVHAVEIVGYKHPIRQVRDVWKDFYTALCLDCHMRPELPAELDLRLGDNLAGWLASQETPLGSIVQ